MGGAEQTADRHCGVMNGTPLPLSLGEVSERSEDGEGKRGCNTLSVTCGDSSPKGRASGETSNFAWTAKASHFGGGGCDQREQTERARMLTMCSIPSVSDFYTFFSTYWRVPMPTFSACSRVAFHSMLGLESLKLSW